jgi:Glycosyltransferase family 87
VTIRLGSRALAGRPALVGLAFLSVLIGTFAVIRAARLVWAADIHRNLAAASALQTGTFGTTPDYLYSPLAAAMTVPALSLPTDVAVVAWLLSKIGLLVFGTAIATRTLDRTDRVMLGIAVVGFLPLLYDLELGNVTVFVLVALAAIAWTPDRAISGIPMGLILATAPKPQLIPVLLWLALVHRRALVGALVTATVATMVGLALTGPEPYATWIAVLRAPAYLNSGSVINLALWSLPPVIAIAGAVASLGAFVVALRRGYWPGLLAAICIGLLLAPYTLIYGAGLLPAVAPALVRASPRAALGFAITAPIFLVLAFPVWIGLLLALAAYLPAAAWPPEDSTITPQARLSSSAGRRGAGSGS